MAAPAPLVRVTADTRVWIAELHGWIRSRDGWLARIVWHELLADSVEPVVAMVPAGCVAELPEQDYSGVPRRDAERRQGGGEWWRHRAAG